MCSARRLMVFNVCVKFHENLSSGFKVMERTRKLLTHTHTHTHTQRKDENIIPPWHTSYAGGIIIFEQGIASDTIPSHCTILLTGLIARWILIS